MITNKPNQTMKQEQRYNIFKRTHKGLRSMLFDAGAKISKLILPKQAGHRIEAKQSTRSFISFKQEDNIIIIQLFACTLYSCMIEQTI
jgi:hypothetical protein